jgi:hypothetical protein
MNIDDSLKIIINAILAFRAEYSIPNGHYCASISDNAESALYKLKELLKELN